MCAFITVTGGSPFDGIYTPSGQYSNAGEPIYSNHGVVLQLDEVWYFSDSNGNSMLALEQDIEFDGSLNSWAYNSFDGAFSTYTATATCNPQESNEGNDSKPQNLLNMLIKKGL